MPVQAGLRPAVGRPSDQRMGATGDSISVTGCLGCGPSSVTLRSYNTSTAWLRTEAVTVRVTLRTAELRPSGLTLKFTWKYGPDSDFGNDSMHFTDYPLVVRALQVGGDRLSLTEPLEFGLLGNTTISGWPPSTYKRSGSVHIDVVTSKLTPLRVQIRAVDVTDEMLETKPLKSLTGWIDTGELRPGRPVRRPDLWASPTRPPKHDKGGVRSSTLLVLVPLETSTDLAGAMVSCESPGRDSARSPL